MSINFARLNHILIPTTKDGRDRLRKSLLGKLLRPLGFFYTSLSAEGRVFSVLAFVAAAFGFEVRTTETYLLWCALTGLLAASLVFVRMYRMTDVLLDVTAPRRTTVGEPVTFTLTLRNEGHRAHTSIRFRGPFLPWDGRWTAGAPGVASLGGGASAKVEMRARFLFRGEHHLDPFHAQALLPLGLALGPQIATGGCRFLVVPKIANVARLTTPMGRRHQPGGVALASKTGESMDLLGVRPYRVGDPVRDLHARSWAKLGSPVVREYQQEYFSRIGVILDTDRSDADERRLEAAISLAAGVVGKLSRGEALIDLLVVGGHVHTLTLGRSLGYFEQALDLLACVERGSAFDGEALQERLAPHLARLSCVVFVALAWDDARRAFVDRVRRLGIGCSVLLVSKEKDVSRAGDVRAVDTSAIERGEALAL